MPSTAYTAAANDTPAGSNTWYVNVVPAVTPVGLRGDMTPGFPGPVSVTASACEPLKAAVVEFERVAGP